MKRGEFERIEQLLSRLDAGQVQQDIVHIAWSAGTGRWAKGDDYSESTPTAPSKQDRWLALASKSQILALA